VTATSGYHVSVFAKIPSTSTNPDSIEQIGGSVFVGTADDLNPDGTPGPSGKTNVEILQYALDGTLQKTWSVLGHNDGLMAFDSSTLWAMSNEDCNPKLTIINLSAGTQTVYSAQPSLLNASGCLANTNGGLDDMQLMNGTVYVSASNPAVQAGPCPADSSTPGCPNGVSNSNAVYVLTLNSGGGTFDLTPILNSGTAALNIATNAMQTLNLTDPDSEGQTPDGTTLLLDSQQDNELVFIQNPGANQVVSFLPITEGGAPTAGGIDDTRYPPSPAFLLDADTNSGYVYRIDSTFPSGTNAFSSDSTNVSSLNLTTGALSPIVSGLQHSNGMQFIVPASLSSASKSRKHR
jgi:hypothetical protein